MYFDPSENAFIRDAQTTIVKAADGCKGDIDYRLHAAQLGDSTKGTV